jgi:hypothetical protein
VSSVKYELDFISQKTPFFIVTTVKTTNLYMVQFNYIIRSETRDLPDRSIVSLRYRRPPTAATEKIK